MNSYNDLKINKYLTMYYEWLKNFKHLDKVNDIECGLICKLVISLQLASETSVNNAVLEDLKKLDPTKYSATADEEKFNTLGKYFTDYLLTTDKDLCFKLSEKSMNYIYIECTNTTNKYDSLYRQLVKNANILSETRDNLIILAPEYFNNEFSAHTYIPAIIDRFLNEKQEYDIVCLAPDLVTDVASWDYKRLCLASESQVREEPISFSQLTRNLTHNILEKNRGMKLFLSKEYTESYFKKTYNGSQQDWNYEELYFLSYLTLKYDWQVAFEDIDLEERYANCVNVLFMRTYDTCDNRLKWLSQLNGLKVAIVRDTNRTQLCATGTIQFKPNSYVFQQPAIKLSEILNDIPVEALLMTTKPELIKFSYQDLRPVGTWLSVLPNIHAAQLGVRYPFNSETTEKEKAMFPKWIFKPIEALNIFQKLVIDLITNKPINLGNLVFVNLNGKTYLTYLTDKVSMIDVTIENTTKMENGKKIKSLIPMSVPIRHIMPLKAYTHFKFEDYISSNVGTATSNVEPDYDISIPIITLISEMANTSNSTVIKKFSELINQEKFYEALIVIANRTGDIRHATYYNTIKKFDPHFLKNLKYDVLGNIVSTSWGEMM